MCSAWFQDGRKTRRNVRNAWRAALSACGALVLLGGANVWAQAYPTKPVRLIAPFPPGGGTDLLSRIIAVPVSESFGQPVVVDNRPGAGGAIGAELTARAAPDGYTLILVSSSYCATSAYQKTPYDPVKDIEPIILIGTTGLVVSVHPQVAATSIKALISQAKASPGRLNYASVGPGTVAHLGLELFKQMSGTNIVHVPYKGGGPALNAVIGGEVQVTLISLVPTIPHARAGRLRPLGVTTAKRSPLLPDVPPIGETVPGYEVTHWYGMWGPKGIPKPIIARWNKEVAKVLLGDAMKRQMQNEGLETAAGPPDEFRTVVGRDVAKWRRVIDEAKLGRAG
jgi:tripartite-type tricarboxylate transporter receptor subunit TctC